MLKELMIRVTFIAFVYSISLAAHAMADGPKEVNVPPGNLVPALEALAKQEAVELVYQPEQLKSFHTQGVKGSYTPQDAVRLLLKGTPLELRTDPSGAMVISVPGAKPLSQSAGADGTQEAKSNSSGTFLLAQTTPGQSQQDVSVEQRDDQTKKQPGVEEVVVTGSRIPRAATQGPQDVQIYTKAQITESGQTTVADFLNTNPDVSISIGEQGFQTQGGATTVQLHGLPLGTTLVLINGRRTEVSGETSGQGDFFDLNNIPLAAVERIEVQSAGSSAIYGSDAIAGVVNIILKESFEGLEANAKYGYADDTHQWHADAAWGQRWDKASVSIIGSFETRTPLTGFGRTLTSSNDYSRYASDGGFDNRNPTCYPGNVFSTNGGNLPGLNSPYAAVPAGYTGTPSIAEFASTAGTLNECSIEPYNSWIPETQREGFFLQGHYSLSPALELFTEVMYSHVEQTFTAFPADLYGIVGYQQYTVGATNPFNPFGQPVGVGILFPTEQRTANYNSNFFRPLVGVKGDLAHSWHWEIAAWDSRDAYRSTDINNSPSPALIAALNSSNPATALNPFTALPAGSTALLDSLFLTYLQRFWGEDIGANAFMRGPLFDLPAGPVQAAVGTSYDRNELSTDNGNFNFNTDVFGVQPATSWHRDSYAVFAEARVPLWASHERQASGETLAVDIAGRYDHYSDFGSKTTPQFGLEWRPLSSLLIRGTYADAFKAPTLQDLYLHQSSLGGVQVPDPQHGNQIETVTDVMGGNPNLRPETGQSRTVGFTYSSATQPGLRLTVERWNIDLSNNIQTLSPEVIAENEAAFPGDVIRATSCSSAPPCPITEVIATYANYGHLHVDGLDYEISYDYTGALGQFAPSLRITQTNRYTAGISPGAPITDRTSKANDDGDWAPRWKGTAALSWKLGAYSASVDGRYVGRYQDYDSTQEIGNFWLCDANFRYVFGEAVAPHKEYLKNSYVEIGGVNIFNRLPQFSNYYFDYAGYDPAEGDIRGRFMYMSLGVKW